MDHIQLLASIIKKHKDAIKDTPPDMIAAAKILDFIEKRHVTTLNDIMKSLYRHVTREDAERIMATFVAAGVVAESQHGNQVLYTCLLKPLD